MTGATIDVPVMCGPCGQPFTVHVPVRTEPVDGWHRVVVNTDWLTLAVRAHARQHEAA